MKFKLFAFMLLFSGALIAQDSKVENKGDRRQERLERMESLKIAYITKELNLTSEESQVFWPVYNKHNERLKEIRSSIKPKRKGEDMTEAEADRIIQQYVQSEYDKAKVHEEMINELKPIIGSKRVIKLFKVESKFKKEILKRTEKRKNQKGSRKGNGNR
jgi:hypothetical protein